MFATLFQKVSDIFDFGHHVVHSVEITEFLCHSDFTSNQMFFVKVRPKTHCFMNPIELITSLAINFKIFREIILRLHRFYAKCLSNQRVSNEFYWKLI